MVTQVPTGLAIYDIVRAITAGDVIVNPSLCIDGVMQQAPTVFPFGRAHLLTHLWDNQTEEDHDVRKQIVSDLERLLDAKNIPKRIGVIMLHEIAEIKKIRKKLGITQNQLAKAAGVSQSCERAAAKPPATR